MVRYNRSPSNISKNMKASAVQPSEQAPASAEAPSGPATHVFPVTNETLVSPSAEQTVPYTFAPVTQMPLYQQQIPVCPYTGIPLIPDSSAGFMPSLGMQPMMGYGAEANLGSVQQTTAVSDPPPILTDNSPVPTITLFKELSGYPNYGNPSGNADILYTGNRGAWTFNLPAIIFNPGQFRAQLVIRAVLDDHSNVPVNRYSARIIINDTVVHNGRLDLRHGTPAGSRFTNWSSLTFNVPNLRRNNRIVIENTSTAGANDWIALDWMELRLSLR